ncbi:MAG: cysteine--tRNA ligase [Pseudomonadota bacterium]
MLEIFNTLTGEKAPFKPIQAGRVGMYVCGVTVYDYCHLGHARMLVVFDMVSRYLRSLDLEVTYVRNITDIEDKIIARARENGEPEEALTERFIAAMNEDCAALGILPPDVEPRATEFVGEMIAITESLIEKGLAYVGDNQDVYFSVPDFADYGALSGNRLEDLQAGTRVDVEEAKRNELDFVLWKAAKPGEPTWPSPWGPGRPGWHIECSAMSIAKLGTHFDIHGGGRDLTFPHHECEIAQSRGATGDEFANVWMHNGFVRIDEEKMSKSLDNFLTIREALEDYPGEVLRYYMLTSHYRSPLNYSDESITQAGQALSRLYIALRGLALTDDSIDSQWLADFRKAMDDDFNTPEALAVLHECATEVNRLRAESESDAASLAMSLRGLGEVLGLLDADPETFLQAGGSDDALSAGTIEALLAERATARARKDFAEADRIRDRLVDGGIILEDSGGETQWRRG